jgi:hypothetical protein
LSDANAMSQLKLAGMISIAMTVLGGLAMILGLAVIAGHPQ